VRRPRGLVARGDDDRTDDQRRAGQRGGRGTLAEEQRPERDRDERVHVLVGHDLRDRGVLQKPGVRAETDHRSHDREVRPRRDRSGLERVRAELRCLAGDEPRADEHEPAAEHLVDRRDERVAG